MTPLTKPITRRTVTRYRITVSGCYADQTGGRPLVVELASNKNGDILGIREAGRRTWVRYDIGELYRKGLIKKARGK